MTTWSAYAFVTIILYNILAFSVAGASAGARRSHSYGMPGVW